MKKILIINGPNLNMLGKRNPDIYGSKTLKEINREIKNQFKQIKIVFFQSNSEEKIIKRIHNVNKEAAIIVNLGAFTHTSIAIRDALEIVKIPIIAVHLSNINEREEFRKIDYIKDIATKSFMGKKVNSYIDAINFLQETL